MNSIQTNPVIIIGAGVAGLMAAISLAERNIDCLLISDNPPDWAPSANSFGGFNAVTEFSIDSQEQHWMDTLSCGEFLNKEKQVRSMLQMAPTLLSTLGHLGVPWQTESANRHRTFRGMGSSKSRYHAASELTGKSVSWALRGLLRKYIHDKKISFLSGWDFLSLVKDDQGQCRGVCVMDKRTLEVKSFPAAAVVIATGGYSDLFGEGRFLGRSDGSGLSVVYQQGAHLENLEFLQWHPFCVSSNGAGSGHGQMMSEPQWFEKCFWVNRQGKPWYFMEDFFGSGWMAQNTTDLTRAVLQVTLEMGLAADEQLGIYADAKLVGRAYGTNSLLDSHRIVSPQVVMSLGGLQVNDFLMTTLPGVFAVGEACSGYHGACALSGNELLSAVASGRQVVEGIENYLQHNQYDSVPVQEAWLTDEMKLQHSVNNAIIDLSGPENLHLLALELRNTLGDMSVFGCHAQTVQKASEKVAEIKINFQKITLGDRGRHYNRELLLARRFYNVIELTQAFVLAAGSRKETRGCHERSDFPQKNDALKNSKMIYAAVHPQLMYEDVTMPSPTQSI